MTNKSNNLPIGALLRNAGLISDEQLQDALKLQSQYTQMRLGEILVFQESISAKTINFFVNQWKEIVEQGQQFPIGHYFKKASLLNDEQIQTILKEQQFNKQKFGNLAIQKGWIKPDTLKFFLDNLSLKPPRPLTLSQLEEYDSNTFNLKHKYVNPSFILGRILAWTGGNPTLAKIICHAFAYSDFNVPAGLETDAVDRFVEESLIKSWQTSKAANYIRYIKYQLLNNQQCAPKALLQEYQNVLLLESKIPQQSKEEKELLRLGLIVKEQNRLKIANLIYQKIFNLDWTIQQSNNLSKKSAEQTLVLSKSKNSLIPINSSQNNATNVDVDSDETNQSINAPEPLTRMSSLITVSAIILLIPLFFAVNNYYSLLSKQSKLSSRFFAEADALNQFCDRLDFSDLNSSLNLISRLEQNKRKFIANSSNGSEVFPDNCEAALNQLRVLTAPQLGRESRVLEAVRNLCKVPVDSESFNEAKVWLNRWYNSPSWGDDTQAYLNLIADCPVKTNAQQ